jgi:hypothetical protein
MNGITKLQISDRKINPFGGINFIISAMREKKIDELIDKHLGKRPKQANYSYSDVILSWIYANLCGAERLEDIQHIRTLFHIPGLKVPSSDRISQIFRSLATKKEIFKGTTGIEHEFNTHSSLNNLMFDIISKLNLLKNQDYILDYDNTVIECEKFDSKKSYLLCNGYQPAVCFINKLPVYIENRNGNSPAKYKLNETLERGLEFLWTKGININKIRSDSAAYQSKIFKLLDKHPSIEYFIRVPVSKYFCKKVFTIKKWEYKRNFEAEIGDKPFFVFGKWRRLLAIRKQDSEGEYTYSGILTNNLTMVNQEVLFFYNQRGAIERNFDDLKNNFNWSRLPFSFLNENTVFLIIGAIAHIIYQYVINAFSKKLKFVKKNFRLKNFIFNFITVGSEWVDQNILRLYTSKPYQKLMIC